MHVATVKQQGCLSSLARVSFSHSNFILYPIQNALHSCQTPPQFCCSYLAESIIVILRRQNVILKANIIMLSKQRSVKGIERQPVLQEESKKNRKY